MFFSEIGGYIAVAMQQQLKKYCNMSSLHINWTSLILSDMRALAEIAGADMGMF